VEATIVKKFTLEELKLLGPERRAVLYENAKKHLHEGGQEVIDLIEASGLPLRAGGMRMSDPVYIRMEEIAWSPEGRAAALKATKDGLPALAGVEPLIREALGDRYNPHDMGTMNAGYIVGEVMRHLGYVDAGQSKMPEGSVAKTAMIWKSRRQ
jgi:hypothetical protein